MTYSEIGLYILLVLLILGMVLLAPPLGSTAQFGLLGAVFFATLFGTGLAWKECGHKLENFCSSHNVIRRITMRVKHYLESVSNECLIWKPGPDFYWLEVHNVKVRKRKFQQNNDDF